MALKIANGNTLATTTTPGVIQPDGSTLTVTSEGVVSADGPAGGDLSGNYPNPTVAKVQGVSVSTTGPTTGQFLQFDGTEYTPVDLPASPTGTYYLDITASPISGYYSLVNTFPGGSENTLAVTASGTTEVNVGSFASSALEATLISDGIWTPKIYASVSTLANTPSFVLYLYKRDTAGTETLLGSESIQLTATGTTEYISTIEVPTTSVNPTDVIVFKVNFQPDGAISKTFTIYFDGATHVSHLDAPIPSINAIKSIPVKPQTGTSYTVLDADRGFMDTFNNASAVAVTLPQAGASSQFLNGWFFYAVNLGVGAVTITPTTSTINLGSSLVLNTGESALIASDGTNYNASLGKASGSAAGVSSLDGITGAITLAAGSGITITDNSPAAGSITIAATGGGGGFTPAYQTLTFGSPTTSWNASLGSGIVTLTGNTTIGNPTGAQAGMIYFILLQQDATGSRRVAWGSNFRFPSGGYPTVSSNANSVTSVAFVSDGTLMYEINVNGNQVAASTTPPSSGLLSWLKASAITGVADGGSVATWPDSSGAANDFTQTTTTSQPTYHLNVLNGSPSVRFTAAGTEMNGPAAVSGLTTFSIYIVYSCATASSGDHRAIQGSNNWLMGPYTGYYEFYNGTFLQGPAVAANQFVLSEVVTSSSSSSFFYVNSVYVGSNSSSTVPGSIYIGGANTTGGGYNELLDGDIVEVLIYNVAHTNTERQQVETYIKNTYAIF